MRSARHPDRETSQVTYIPGRWFREEPLDLNGPFSLFDGADDPGSVGFPVAVDGVDLADGNEHRQSRSLCFVL